MIFNIFVNNNFKILNSYNYKKTLMTKGSYLTAEIKYFLSYLLWEGRSQTKRKRK